MASAVPFSVIKHKKIRQSQSLIEFVTSFDWLKRRQLSIRNWTSAKLLVSSGFKVVKTRLSPLVPLRAQERISQQVFTRRGARDTK